MRFWIPSVCDWWSTVEAQRPRPHPSCLLPRTHAVATRVFLWQIQDLAIRCIQKNIKKNRGVKGWPWWKLFTTVRPLIEVQLTEEQIRGKDVRIWRHKHTHTHTLKASTNYCVNLKIATKQLMMFGTLVPLSSTWCNYNTIKQQLARALTVLNIGFRIWCGNKIKCVQYIENEQSRYILI